jgi:hypothetical protein
MIEPKIVGIFNLFLFCRGGGGEGALKCVVSDENLKKVIFWVQGGYWPLMNYILFHIITNIPQHKKT